MTNERKLYIAYRAGWSDGAVGTGQNPPGGSCEADAEYSLGYSDAYVIRKEQFAKAAARLGHEPVMIHLA